MIPMQARMPAQLVRSPETTISHMHCENASNPALPVPLTTACRTVEETVQHKQHRTSEKSEDYVNDARTHV